jgi:hypothetical protein
MCVLPYFGACVKKDNDKKANWLFAPVAGLPVPEILSGAHKDLKI